MADGALLIGCGSAYAEDRIELAEDMVARGGVKYVAMDCLAERTLSMAQLRRLDAPDAGYDLRMQAIADRLVPSAFKQGVRLIGNFGAANPEGAVQVVVSAARRMGLEGLRVASVTGDDVLELIRSKDCVLAELGTPVSKVQGSLVSANAYIGADSVVEALRLGAHVVVTGRVADPSLFLAPMVHEYGWRADDWHRKGAGTMLAHLLECGVHVTGGNFADPPYKVVPDLVNPSMPLVEMDADGNGVLTKLPGTGGLVSEETCKTQLVYEIHDPSKYLTPDVTANFTNVEVKQIAANRVRCWGASGSRWPEMIKVLAGVREGWIGEGQVSYAGPRALERARLAQDVLRKRFERFAPELQDVRFDLLGVNAIHGPRSPEPTTPPYEVHVRAACRTMNKRIAEEAAHEVEYLQIFGPAATGGHRKGVRPVLSIYTTYLPRDCIETRVQVTEV